MNRKQRRAQQHHAERAQRKAVRRLTSPERFKESVLALDLRDENVMLGYVEYVRSRLTPMLEELGEVPLHFQAFAPAAAGGTQRVQYTPGNRDGVVVEKCVAASVFRSCCQTLLAFASLTICEGWMLSEEQSPEQWCDRFDEHPGRKEVVMVTLEHRTLGSLVWLAELGRDGQGKRAIGEFAQCGSLGSGSRLGGFLPTPSNAVLN